MCGIVGYIGAQQAQDILLDGLSRLEYRGYDSAGIAVMDGGVIRLARRRDGWRTLPRGWHRIPCPAPSASVTRAGQPTANQTTSTPIRTRT